MLVYCPSKHMALGFISSEEGLLTGDLNSHQLLQELEKGAARLEHSSQVSRGETESPCDCDSSPTLGHEIKRTENRFSQHLHTCVPHRSRPDVSQLRVRLH